MVDVMWKSQPSPEYERSDTPILFKGVGSLPNLVRFQSNRSASLDTNIGNMVQLFDRPSRASVHPLGDIISEKGEPEFYESDLPEDKFASEPTVAATDDDDDDRAPSISNISSILPVDDDPTDSLQSNSTLFFRDKRRRIDMILVYESDGEGEEAAGKEGEATTQEDQAKQRGRRKMFQENLEKEGLELEVEEKSRSYDEKTNFVKVHIPWKSLRRYAEVMNLKMPIKSGNEGKAVPQESGVKWALMRVLRLLDYDHERIPKEPSFYKATYSRDREEQFVVKDRDRVFTPAQRSQIVWQVMMRAKYDVNDKVGIRRLLNNKSYLAAFPLHEGRYDVDSESGQNKDRRLLYLEWARPKKWFKKQPIWLIKKYFGEKIGLYFAWLGFYTTMLIPASIVGVLCFIYGLASMNSKENIPSKEICNVTGVGNITMCPTCDKACNYMKLGDSCLFSQMAYLFDNPATVFFAIFMSFWATTFLEMWKRRQAVIVWEWDLQDTEEDEEPRPEFEATVKTYRINPVTREKEPYLPIWNKVVRYTATGSIVLFMLAVVMGAVLGTIIYRLSVVSVIHGRGGAFLRKNAKLFTSITAAVINLIAILILTKFYQTMALWMVNLENPRTQTEYEQSYTFKIFVFQFINFYSSLIYIAFFKGRFFIHPGDVDARSSEFLRLRTDVCDPAGCLSELCIQLSIIMVGKQALNNCLEILYPKLRNWWRKRSQKMQTVDQERRYKRWEEDYQLQDAGRLALFEEYLEMVLQYGFVTLFVAAFPLAPLFALLNNIGEIRLDAYKMLTQIRRPLAERVQDIGAWYGILQGLTYAAVVSNAFVIAYTSDFIPRMVYSFVYSKTQDLQGYIDSSLSEFSTSDYTEDMGSDNSEPDPPTCQYRGYRNGPEHEDKYGLSPQYWHVFAARLAFVVVFEHIVFALTGVMAYIIPDVPSEVKTQIQREKLLAKEAKYEHAASSSDDRSDRWGRRSRLSDMLEAHVEVGSRHRNINNSKVWQAGGHRT